MTFWSEIWEWLDGFCVVLDIQAKLKMVTALYTFPNVFSEFLPVYEIQEQKNYQKGVSFLPFHMLKEMWLYW